jgi:NADH dehydrogenase FAD-containing subunit
MTQTTEATESQPTAASSMEEVDVAILGAGPAGLSTALGLHKACPDLKARSASHVATCAMLQHAHLEGTIKHLLGKEQESMFAKAITKCPYDRIKCELC